MMVQELVQLQVQELVRPVVVEFQHGIPVSVVPAVQPELQEQEQPRE